MADQYIFLTDEWIEAAQKIRDDMPSPEAAPAHQVKMNLVITDTPEHENFPEGRFEGHMDTSSGEMDMDKGHLDGPDLTVTVDYETAKAIFVDQNPQAGMQAFMAGKVKVEGDITKLMAMQNAAPDPNAQAITGKIKEVTA